MTDSGGVPRTVNAGATAIERVTIDDLQEVLALMEWTVATSVDAPPAARAAFVANVRANVERWAATPTQSIHLKFVEQGRIVGTILVRDWWNLCALFVAPTHHRRGVGSALMREAIDRCRDKATHPSIRLNAAFNAVAFYRMQGFREVEGAASVLSAVPMEFQF